MTGLFAKKNETIKTKTPQKKDRKAKLAWLQAKPTKMTAYIAIFVLTLLVSTITANEIMGVRIVSTKWFWIVLFSVATIFLVGCMKNQINIDTAAKIAKWIIPTAIIMLVVSISWRTVIDIELQKPPEERPAWLKDESTHNLSIKGLTTILKIDYDTPKTHYVAAKIVAEKTPAYNYNRVKNRFTDAKIRLDKGFRVPLVVPYKIIRDGPRKMILVYIPDENNEFSEKSPKKWIKLKDVKLIQQSNNETKKPVSEKVIAKWWRHKITLPPGGSEKIGKIRNGDKLLSLSVSDWQTLTGGEKAYKKTGRDFSGGPVETRFYGISGIKNFWFINPNDKPIVIYYKFM